MIFQRSRASHWIVATGAALTLWVTISNSQAATYTDSQNLISLAATPTVSSAAGHLAWQFAVSPLSPAHEIGSIDVATGAYGFSGEMFRQVNPSGQPTVFADLNNFFPAGEDETTDTQFSFNAGGLNFLPQSAQESDLQLEAAFTGFNPILADSSNKVFAQIVQPFSQTGTFFGAFALRPAGGGVSESVEVGPISFSILPGDFDFDQDVDDGDLVRWRDTYARGEVVDADGDSHMEGTDFLIWQRQVAEQLAAIQSVPEPTGGLIFASIVAFSLHCRTLARKP